MAPTLLDKKQKTNISQVVTTPTPKFADYLLPQLAVRTNCLTLTLLHITKPHKNYLQNTQHVVLRNRPTLSIGTERLACLNNPRGVQLGTLA